MSVALPVSERSDFSTVRHRTFKALIAGGGTLAVLLGVGWTGLQARPASFAPVLRAARPPETVQLPAGLPAPVERFYRVTYGDRVPVINSAVMSGRANIRLFGVTFPARFRFTHASGPRFASYIEVTFFGVPIMKVYETYLDGKGRGETPFGIDQGAKVDQATNVRVWAEQLMWAPAMLLSDPRVRWEAIDDATALLVVPFKPEEEHFVVRFDPESRKVLYAEAMRYKKADSPAKTLWVSGIWLGDEPWAAFDVEDVALNGPVDRLLEPEGR